MGPARDAEFAAEFLEDRLADVNALADLEEGHLKVLGQLLERELLLARSDNATRRRQSRRNWCAGGFVTRPVERARTVMMLGGNAGAFRGVGTVFC